MLYTLNFHAKNGILGCSKNIEMFSYTTRVILKKFKWKILQEANKFGQQDCTYAKFFSLSLFDVN